VSWFLTHNENHRHLHGCESDAGEKAGKINKKKRERELYGKRCSPFAIKGKEL
jgi:hypothetical protein